MSSFADEVDFHGVLTVESDVLTQFGIARDVELRRKFEREAFPDDRDEKRKFRPGYMSFAGNGVDSRTTEVFIVMPGKGPSMRISCGSDAELFNELFNQGTPQHQLNYFGQNSWVSIVREHFLELRKFTDLFVGNTFRVCGGGRFGCVDSDQSVW